MPTTSSLAAEALKTFKPEDEFTSRELANLLSVSEGPVTGFMSRALQCGAVKVVRTAGRQWVYSVLDASLVEGRTRENGGGGGAVGRKMRTKTSAQKNADLLRAIADEVEKHPTTLDGYTTAELIRELARRDRASSRTDEVESE